MKCISCQQKIEEGSVFCELCGTIQNAGKSEYNKHDSENSEKMTIKEDGFEEERQIVNNPIENNVNRLDQSDEVIQGADGAYRWVYELNMWTNSTIMITLLKILIFSTLVPTIFVSILALFETGLTEAIVAFMKVGGILVSIVLVLLAIAYPLVAIMNGGKYCVAFEMDEKGIKHIQMDKQFKRSQVLSMITTLAGALSNNPTVTGAGLLANAKKSSYSQFSKVKSVMQRPKRNVIYVNESFERNQIYVDQENIDFVYDYIIKRCKKAVKENR